MGEQAFEAGKALEASRDDEVPSCPMENRVKKLNEKTITKQESRIPELAADAVKQARKKTLGSGRSVIEAVDGKLIESHPDGTQNVLKIVPAPTPVAVGQKKIRKAK